jgi:hypothetical protein
VLLGVARAHARVHVLSLRSACLGMRVCVCACACAAHAHVHARHTHTHTCARARAHAHMRFSKRDFPRRRSADGLLNSPEGRATGYQISHNKSLDGILDQLNSRRMTDAGPLDLIDDPPSDEDDPLLPLTAGGA